ncbi:MAG: SH3 domain-containing protein [Eubacteriales bacterium]|jgi:uncharacterized protein YgiM (DUF1202 family)|nr:SH3 domain-containing protein [Eubacteriales bacterium]MDD4135104.1 SH3 domain-containing protein [Eubacteriales bacterium]NLO13937.1 SH3 domain-containing protein [Clostridiales bacterium]
MKRVFSLLTAVFLLAAMLPAAASIYDPDAIIMYVITPDGNKLNMREEPDPNARVLTKIPYGAEVTVYSDILGMVWYHIQYGMFNGYVKTEFLTDRPPRPFITPTPKPTAKPTPKPTPTATPSPAELIAREIEAARSLGLVPQGMVSEGNVTWQELDGLLTNAVRLKSKNPAAIRSHVYLTLEEYQAANAGAQFNIVLRGVAAAEMYGALIDMGEEDPRLNHSHDPYIADAADITKAQEYAGVVSTAGSADWRQLSLLDMVIAVLDHADTTSGNPVMDIDAEHLFFPTHPLTRAEAILGVYRLYRSFHTGIGTVLVTHIRQANLRAEPSMKAAIIGKADPGNVYEVVGIPANGWYQIMLPNGSTAYIAAGMVSFTMN